MQTTLRIDGEIYRQAKAEAAREGITLTKFIEEALELRLRQAPAPATLGELPVFRGGPPLPPDFDLVKTIKEPKARRTACSRTSYWPSANPVNHAATRRQHPHLRLP
jgi:hypothetical protein